MKEIGGYLELGSFFYKSYHNKAIALNTATNALIYLTKARKINKLYVPYYMCDCLDKVKKYCEIEYYRIKKDFTPDFNLKLEDNEYLYIVNYFGIFDNSDIEKYKEKYKNIVVDNVQPHYGEPKAIGYAKVYDTVDDLQYIEAKHVLAKNEEPEEEPAEDAEEE